MYNTEEEKTEHTGKEVSFFRFEDLRIYHKSLDYINWLNDVNMLFPENDTTGLVQRLNASARNIAFFITEGSSRNKSQFVHYLKMAKTAIRECLVMTSIAYRANFLTDTYEQESRQFLMELTKMTGALISSLQRANNSNGYHNNGYHNNSNNHANYGNHSESHSADESDQYQQHINDGM